LQPYWINRGLKSMKNIVFVLLVFTFSGCSEDFIATYCPDEKENNWLDDKIKSLEKSDYGSELYYYQYKGESVFLLNSCTNCSDWISVVYNCQGAVICEFGGIAGLNTCPDFGTEAKEEKLLFSKKPS